MTEDEDILDFLLRELPPRRTKEASHFAKGVKEAGARYDRYVERRLDWISYSDRGSRLRKIGHLSEGLATALSELDILSRDDLTSRIGPDRIDNLVGLLGSLTAHAAFLHDQMQVKGKRTDLAGERWVLDLADIYENAFSRKPSVSGSDDDRRGKFYQMLKLARPSRFSQHGNLSRKHIQALLTMRRGGPSSIAEFNKLAGELSRGAKTRLTRGRK